MCGSEQGIKVGREGANNERKRWIDGGKTEGK